MSFVLNARQQKWINLTFIQVYYAYFFFFLSFNNSLSTKIRLKKKRFSLIKDNFLIHLDKFNKNLIID